MIAGPLFAGGVQLIWSRLVGSVLLRDSVGASIFDGGSSTSVTVIDTVAVTSADESGSPASSSPSLTLTVSV